MAVAVRSEEHTSELQSLRHLVCRLLLEKTKNHTSWSPVCRFRAVLLPRPRHPRPLHSFPTRRSSDLGTLAQPSFADFINSADFTITFPTATVIVGDLGGALFGSSSGSSGGGNGGGSEIGRAHV